MARTVVIVGGGYGGTLVAKELDATADVVLIDPREGFVNAAASLRALTRPDWAPNAFFPYGKLLRHGRVLRDEAVSVDPAGVTLASGARVPADYLVLATGSGYSYPAKPHPGATDVAQQLDDLHQTHHHLSGAGRVLILGAGPVGIELAGEIKEVWPDKEVTVVDRGDQLLPGFLPEVRDSLLHQLTGRGVRLLLGTGLTALPPVPPGEAARFEVTTADGETIGADIWFRAFGVRINTGCLADGRLTTLTGQTTIPVTDHLTVRGHDHVYAIGDIADLPDPKMASYAMEHAMIVAANIKAQLAGERPEAVYTPSPDRRILLPLGTEAGVGQLPGEHGPVAASVGTVRERKGADLFTARFAARFDQD
ncbi:NAD(P)/FAD-dependent oxidoreductase [Actinoplanes sp. N902-109]|uniref:NAD(P)/FAD-dependent oxidoreductase n=1 Tax=Actinoplanes sp. (strain N902-109) TaxID=649831 RepID=UPI0003294BEB|nr:FAD-dependent oxidoreductase [Actinoplanes sp. N902-109]AGL12191.1 FAD-dependent pyridine nucleotide-disulfide oxidoreductase [Actinoplanes sp. N902-109]AGL16457.1 FAD-dependent pyridine nucleotide-disulfide oxidoreductase [Actinoplanes sp. N902-109]